MILIYLAAAWGVGILVASFLKFPTDLWLLLLLLPLAYLALFWYSPPLRKWHFVLLVFILGALRFQLELAQDVNQDLQQFNEQGRVSLIGVVIAEPDVRQTQTLVRVDVAKIQTKDTWREIHGLALVSVPRDAPVRYGDQVQVDGAPETPPDGADFSYRDYLAREHVFTLIKNARVYTITSGKGEAFWTTLLEFKSAARTAIAQLLPEPSAALLTGILLGDDKGIPRDLHDAFANTNTAHIIAISGFNIAVLIGILSFILRRPAAALQFRAAANAYNSIGARAAGWFNQFFVTALIFAFLILYTLLVGASASVVRACIMGSLAVLAFQLGRQSWAFNALAVAAFIMSLLNPYVLWDVGFQLSFLATLGLLIYAPRLKNLIGGMLKTRVGEARARHALDFLNDAFIVTAAAFFVTAPLIIVYFHRVSFVGFLTNFLILPIQPLVMVFGGAATILQVAANALRALPIIPLLLGALAQVLAWGAYVCLQYTILVVQATAAVPFGSFAVERVDAPIVIVFYLVIAITTRLGIRQTIGLFLSRVWVAVALLAVVTMFVYTTAVTAADTRTRISFIAASEGDATFIRTGNDERILINGTNEPSVVLSFLGTQLPPWDRRLDLVIATHVDDDNLASLNAVIERYNVARVIEPHAPARPGVSYAKWRDLINKAEIPVFVATRGVTAHAGESTLQVIYPAEENDVSSVALLLDTSSTSFLLAPALKKTDREKILESDALFDADVAVLPNELENEWIERVTPATVIFFAGPGPRAQPSEETLDVLHASTILRTDQNGTITYILDGDRVQVQAEHQ